MIGATGEQTLRPLILWYMWSSYHSPNPPPAPLKNTNCKKKKKGTSKTCIQLLLSFCRPGFVDNGPCFFVGNCQEQQISLDWQAPSRRDKISNNRAGQWVDFRPKSAKKSEGYFITDMYTTAIHMRTNSRSFRKGKFQCHILQFRNIYGTVNWNDA